MHESVRVAADRAASTPRLPLVAVEHYMLADDRPDYPMAFYVRLILDKLPNREALARAVASAVARHPLVSATVTPATGRRRFWKWDISTQPIIVWDSGPPSEEPIDLSRQCGLRIKVESIAEGAVLTLEFHHACCDGLGALDLTRDLLIAYKKDRAGEAAGAPPAPTPDAEALKRLAGRGKFGVGPLHFMLRLPLELLGALGVVEFLLHRPQPLAGSYADAPLLTHPADVEPKVSHWPDRFPHVFTVEETQALRRNAAAENATLNDLLVRDLFLTVGSWIDQRLPSKKGSHVRVMVPVNLRIREDGELSAANVVAMINLDRRPRRWQNHARMLRMLHREMAVVKKARLGLTFIRAIQFTHYVMGKLKLLLAADKCQATCVLSNLGVPWRDLAGPDGRVSAGDITVQQLELLPPIRQLTGLSIGVASYAGRLTLAMHFDRRVFSPQQSAEFRNSYVERLRQSCRG